METLGLLHNNTPECQMLVCAVHTPEGVSASTLGAWRPRLELWLYFCNQLQRGDYPRQVSIRNCQAIVSLLLLNKMKKGFCWIMEEYQEILGTGLP